MIKALKNIIKNFLLNKNKIYLKLNALEMKLKELEWANAYHDSIRGNKQIEELALNIGRWSGNYSFFYILNRILFDYKPSSILEFGLGESTKFVSTYIKNNSTGCNHIVIEQSLEWIEAFQLRTNLAENTTIIHCPIETKIINNNKVVSYSKFNEKINQKFDLYIVDGPWGSDRYSRYDIISLVKEFGTQDQFIIIFDDTNRIGEKDTVQEIDRILTHKNIIYHKKDYVGIKSNTVIATEQYKFATSL